MRKIPKIKYVDMCIYIDNTAYTDEHNADTIFEYLQCIIYALAVKKRFFYTEKDYDNYSIYVAEQIYLRLISPRQYLDDNNPRKLPKIKSVLNYIKKAMGPLKINYQQDNFGQIYLEDKSPDIHQEIQNQYSQTITTQSHSLLNVEFERYFLDISKTVQNYLKTTIYSNDNVMMHRLFMSCMLSMIKSFTLSNHNKIRLQNSGNQPNLIDKLYAEENNTCITT